MLVFVWPPRESEGTTGVQLKIPLFSVPSVPPVRLEVPHGTWSIIVTEKMGREREKNCFFISPLNRARHWVSSRRRKCR